MKTPDPDFKGGGGAPSRPEYRVISEMAGPSTQAGAESQPHLRKRSRLWLWFVAAFVVQVAAWTAWFTIAAKHRVQEVPLATTDRH